MGMRLSARFDEVLGSSWDNDNDYADLYDAIMEDVSKLAKNEGVTKKDKEKEYKDLQNTAAIGSTLEYLTATGLDTGWMLRDGYSAVLADTVTNTYVSKLKSSGLDLKAEAEEKNDKIYQEIYDMIAKSLYHIENILNK